VVDTRGLKRRYRTMPFLQVNGTRLHYERTGAGDPLVLVHGSWVDSGVWEAVLPTLARSFDVVSYDRRGHSRSSCPPGEGSIRDDVEDLAGLIELLGLSPACVAGASLGGSITLRLAAARPELVRSAAVHEPPLFDLLKSEDADWPELAELRLRLAAVATWRRATWKAGPDCTSIGWRQRTAAGRASTPASVECSWPMP